MESHKGYILIAEDDPDDQLLLRSAFAELSLSHELVFVENGIELISYFDEKIDAEKGRLPNLLIVDLNMPRKNGREAIKELVTKDYFWSFPTVIFSTTGNEIDRAHCRDLGIKEYFVKPSNYHQLVSMVNQFSAMAARIRHA